MKLTTHSAVPVYTIAGSSTARPLPEWLARKRKRSLKNDPEYTNRVELLQDFEFEEASSCVRVSEDGDWVMSTGTYKPQIHAHYLPHLSLSFARHTSSLNLTFLLLSGDYSKSIHLQTDRSIEFHTPQGCHYTTRLPRYGRDLQYDRRSAEALIPAVGVNTDGNGEVFRLNLELGRFMRGYEVDVGGDDFGSAGAGALQGGIHTGSVNTAAVAEESHNLLAFGTSIGTVELWDSRSRSRAGCISIPADLDSKPEVTALDFHRSGLTLATGSSNGLVHLYDLRSPIPLLKKDQGYGYPIRTLTHLTPSTSSRSQTLEPKILSADKRIIKIWDAEDGTPWTSIEPAVDINSVAWCKDSGMLLTANEGKQQHSFFIPQLGPAPRWCSFLDNLVEEMAENPDDPSAFKTGGEVYDNYKFLTVPQLRSLNLDHLIGTTNLLRPYMHGYFVAQRLFEEARLIADPYIWEEERAKRVKEKIDKERESRIRGSKRKVKVKVNKELAEKMLAREEKRAANQHKRAAAITDEIGDAEADAEGLMKDSRFSALFSDEQFAIDQSSREFQLLNPSTKISGPRGLTAVEEEELERTKRARSSSDESDDDDDDGADEITKSNDKSRVRTVPDKAETRISSSSYKKAGHRSQTGDADSRDRQKKSDRRPNTKDVKTTSKSTFLPSLMSGYQSGSESPEPLQDGPAPRKNRMGQQARRALWEKQYGQRANHLQKEQRDRGWDAKRGARADDRGRSRGDSRGGRPSDASRQRKSFTSDEKARVKPSTSKAKGDVVAEGPLHPSWIAAKKAKDQKQTANFEGKKMVFD
ncbi:MAG: Small ribosomal subunit biogenesis [Sarcosagium campestre]|nr:MAG: Small ribosomal subunit biogenesis [Sarcosagium campestre]